MGRNFVPLLGVSGQWCVPLYALEFCVGVGLDLSWWHWCEQDVGSEYPGHGDYAWVKVPCL